MTLKKEWLSNVTVTVTGVSNIDVESGGGENPTAISN